MRKLFYSQKMVIYFLEGPNIIFLVLFFIYYVYSPEFIEVEKYVVANNQPNILYIYYYLYFLGIYF